MTSSGSRPPEIWSRNGQADQQRTLNSNGTVTGARPGLCLGHRPRKPAPVHHPRRNPAAPNRRRIG
ncbi:hypothetical protein [Streptomyces sp. BRA346]|uniref:hypothetical protein n=1 Tax=Streptomyces sp. BRA346 TaxID=2878199 RepID=UPI004062A68B